jgi:CubicO group peptidase (beta-lactamase class C family)
MPSLPNPFLPLPLFLLLLAAASVSAQGQEDLEALPQASAVIESEAASARDPQSAADRELEAYVDGLIATWQTVHGAPGYTVAVVRPGGNVLTKGYGLADIESGRPVDPATTRFYVASISKTFVWTAAMMLVDRGVLDLDEDVNGYLDRYKVPVG